MISTILLSMSLLYYNNFLRVFRKKVFAELFCARISKRPRSHSNRPDAVASLRTHIIRHKFSDCVHSGALKYSYTLQNMLKL